MGVWYTTREQVMAALDVTPGPRASELIDEEIEAGARVADGLCHRRFWPQLDTRTFDWPNMQYAAPWRLWLDANELVSITSISVAGVALTLANVLLRPDTGPPYTHLELDLSSAAAFSSAATHQRAISITGVYAGCALDEVRTGTTAALDGTATTVTYTRTSSDQVGTGSVLRVDSERMIVTDMRDVDTGLDLSLALTAQSSGTTVVLTATATGIYPGDVVTLDSERMLVEQVMGSTLVVRRAWSGSVLATHAPGAGVFAPRQLELTRGALGTTAATHAAAATAYRFRPPGPVSSFNRGLAVNALLQGRNGWAASGDNATEMSPRGLRQMRDDVYATYARKARMRAV